MWIYYFLDSNQLFGYQNLLTPTQRQLLAEALRTNQDLIMKLVKTQSGGFLGTLLASIGIPFAVEVI